MNEKFVSIIICFVPVVLMAAGDKSATNAVLSQVAQKAVQWEVMGYGPIDLANTLSNVINI